MPPRLLLTVEDQQLEFPQDKMIMTSLNPDIVWGVARLPARIVVKGCVLAAHVDGSRCVRFYARRSRIHRIVISSNVDGAPSDFTRHHYSDADAPGTLDPDGTYSWCP